MYCAYRAFVLFFVLKKPNGEVLLSPWPRNKTERMLVGKAQAFPEISLKPVLTSSYKILFQGGKLSAEKCAPDHSFKLMLSF